MKRRSAHKDAAVLVFAVLLLAAGVFVLTGVAQMSATQSLIGQAEWDTLRKRVMLENSRSMARQFMMARMFKGVVSSNVSFFDPDMGGFTLSPVSDTNAGADYWTTLSTTNTNVNLKINPFTLMERGGFYRVVVPGQVADEINSGRTNLVDWNFQVRTRSPITAGYPIVQHMPNDGDVVSLVGAVPYIDMNEAEQFIGFDALPRMPVASVTNTMTRATGDTNGYQGFLDVQPGASAYGFFTNTTYELRPGLTNQAQVVLNLAAVDPNIATPVLRYDEESDTKDFTNGTNVYTDVPVTTMVLQGSDVYNQKPLHIVVPPARTNLERLVLVSNNIRRVYFNRNQNTDNGLSLTVNAQNASSWRLGLTLTRTRLDFRLLGVTVTGGLRSDSVVTFPSGFVNILPEVDPGGLDYIADRMMWLEDYKTP